jgi:two-component system response regulator FixJ
MKLELAPDRRVSAPDVLTIHVVDEDAIDAEALAALVSSNDCVVRIWPSIAGFIATIDQADLGCVVIDPYSSEIDVATLQERLAGPDIGMPCIIVTAHVAFEAAVDAMRRGAIDYLAKPVNPDRLLNAIAVARHRIKQARRRAATVRRVHAALEILSAREREVLEGLTRGWSNKEIARKLAISARTVEIHRANVMAKLDAESLSQALRIAFISQVCGMVNPALHVD